jgi:hypothetical protein
VRATVEPRAGTIIGFAIEILLRIVLFALLYAFAAAVVVIAMALASRAIHAVVGFGQLINLGLDVMMLGMLVLPVMAGAFAGAVVAIGSVLNASFARMLLLSLAATIAPVIYFALRVSLETDTVLHFLAGGLLSGLLGVVMARGAGLLQPDRRLIQDFWR